MNWRLISIISLEVNTLSVCIHHDWNVSPLLTINNLPRFHSDSLIRALQAHFFPPFGDVQQLGYSNTTDTHTHTHTHTHQGNAHRERVEYFGVGKKNTQIHPRPHDGWSICQLVPHGEAPWRSGTQRASPPKINTFTRPPKRIIGLLKKNLNFLTLYPCAPSFLRVWNKFSVSSPRVFVLFFYFFFFTRPLLTDRTKKRRFAKKKRSCTVTQFSPSCVVLWILLSSLLSSPPPTLTELREKYAFPIRSAAVRLNLIFRCPNRVLFHGASLAHPSE